MTATYEILVDGIKVAEMGGDFAQASSPLTLDGDSTPFQVADAKHRKQIAAEKLLVWAWSNGTALCEVTPSDADNDAEIVGDVTVAEKLKKLTRFYISTDGFSVEVEAGSVNDAIEEAFDGEGLGRIDSLSALEARFKKIGDGATAMVRNEDTGEEWNFGPY